MGKYIERVSKEVKDLNKYQKDVVKAVAVMFVMINILSIPLITGMSFEFSPILAVVNGITIQLLSTAILFRFVVLFAVNKKITGRYII